MALNKYPLEHLTVGTKVRRKDGMYGVIRNIHAPNQAMPVDEICFEIEWLGTTLRLSNRTGAAVVKPYSDWSDIHSVVSEEYFELCRCFELALILDTLNPSVNQAFYGTPADRIQRQLLALNILHEPVV